MEIAIEIDREDLPAVESVAELSSNFYLVSPDNFEGAEGLVAVIVTITPITIPAIVLLIREKIRSKKHVKVRMKGIEISGESLDNIEEFLKNIKSHD